MEAAFELTEADLHEVQRHRAERRRRFIRSRFGLFFVTLIACAIVFPVTFVPGFGTGPYLVAAAVALGLSLLFGPLLKNVKQVRARSLQHWALRRATAVAVKQSVMGPVTVVLTATSVKRLREGVPAFEVPARDIKYLTVSQTLLVLHVSLRKVLAVPRRAFPDDATALEFQRRVEAMTGKPAEEIETPPPAA